MSEPMRSVRFREEREADWRELDRLVTLVERRGLRRLTPTDAERLPRLHRAALSALSVARNVSSDRSTLDYLEALCARSWAVLYTPRQPIWPTIRGFFARTFPLAVWQERRVMALTLTLFTLATLGGWYAVAQDPSTFYQLVPQGLAADRGPHATTESLAEVLYDVTDDVGFLGSFAMELWANNTKVAILGFFLGIGFGLPTLYLAYANGMMLGAFFGLYASRGLGWDLFAWIMPHGVPELGALVLASGAGFMLAQGLLFPGRRPRLEALRERGRKAGLIMLGVCVMLVLAAVIEGFIRQLVADYVVRMLMIALQLAFWGWYLGLHGRALAAEESELASGGRGGATSSGGAA